MSSNPQATIKMSDPSEVARILDWDSHFFGKTIGRVNVDKLTPALATEIDHWAKINHADCVYFLAGSNDPTSSRIAEDFGYHLTDIRVTLCHHAITAAEQFSKPSNIREAKDTDIAALRMIAHDAHQDTRFYFDGHFDLLKCAELYEIWIEKSVRGSSAVVLVWEESERPVGYGTANTLPEGGGSIGLVGVDSSYRGRHIGHQLIQQLLEWFANKQVDPVYVVTQGRNVKAQSLYQRCGFTTHSVELWYHKWYG